MLTVSYLHEHNLYIVIPINQFTRRESDSEYLFSDYLDAKNFIDHYIHNPFCADAAYQITEMNRL